MKKNFFFFALLFSLKSGLVYSQSTEEDFIKNTQNDLMIVVAAGGAGAILGLSTLSFVDRPSNHLRNVWSGAALGIIGGVIFVAYNSAQKGSEDLVSSANFETYERISWHLDSISRYDSSTSEIGSNLLNFQF
jgi:hypothetical protein